MKGGEHMTQKQWIDFFDIEFGLKPKFDSYIPYADTGSLRITAELSHDDLIDVTISYNLIEIFNSRIYFNIA